jgi:hypothetical protein
MSKIYVTITADSAAKPRPVPTKPAQIDLIVGSFFLIFDCAAVEPSLTNTESNTYKTPRHILTRAVHLYRCGASLN